VRGRPREAAAAHRAKRPAVDRGFVFASTCRALRTVLRELALQPHQHVPVDEAVLDLYPHMMRRLLEEADRLPGDSIVHVRFEELERDPLGQVERIYRSIKLDGCEVARPRLKAYAHSIRDYSKSSYTFSKESIERVGGHLRCLVGIGGRSSGRHHARQGAAAPASGVTHRLIDATSNASYGLRFHRTEEKPHAKKCSVSCRSPFSR
jgi:hypothetical protein